MKKQIWKFLLFIGKNEIKMPKGAEILDGQTQNGYPCIWALVNPNNETESRYFEAYTTGQDIHFDMGIERKYIGTFQTQSGAFVFHLFERVD